MSQIIKFVLSFLFAISTLLVASWDTFAIEAPGFPACVNPTGSVRVNYSTGVHGIVGNTNTYTGSDVVYTLNSSQTLQCFCADNGSGIQTNWWKVASELSREEIEDFKSKGWNFVADGSEWGLDQGFYLAQNYNYTCWGNGGIGGGDPQVLSAYSAPVIALAATGNYVAIFSSLSLGIVAFLAGVSILRASRSKKK